MSEVENGEETLLRPYTDQISGLLESPSLPVTNEVVSETVNDIINDHALVVIRGKDSEPIGSPAPSKIMTPPGFNPACQNYG